MEKTAIIDVGSNSVRLAVFHGQTAEYKTLITTRLGEGVSSGRLDGEAVLRTVNAISQLKNAASSRGASALYAFATEAVRRAENGSVFLQKTLAQTGVYIYIASGEEEALLAVKGTLGQNDGAVIDLGGASTEIAVQKGRKLVYSHSLPVGAVVLKNDCGTDENKLTAYIAQKTMEYGNIPPVDNVVAVGGTATSVAACVIGLKEYDPDKVHGARITVEQISKLTEKLGKMSPEKIYGTYPVDRRRAEILFGGALLLKGAVEKIGSGYYVASENDNLEGFYALLCDNAIKARKTLL
ncbi:MAG: hypothetical protein J6Z34_06480 [Clostridia bacterium]|nr:hypothetical protein [Clostridia bacterium]